MNKKDARNAPDPGQPPNRRFIWTLFAVMSILGASSVLLRSYTTPSADLQLTPQQWREDLRFLARELPKKHKNAFHFISRERFDAEVADLDGKLEKLDADQILVGMQRIAASIGDGHTGVDLPDTFTFPLIIAEVEGEFRVVRVAPGLEKALGTRVLRIQDTAIAQVKDILCLLTPQDEGPTLYRRYLGSFLITGNVLHGAGITPAPGTARYTLADDSGREFTIQVQGLPATEWSKINWIYVAQEHPLSSQKPQEKFWCTYLSDSRTEYCNVRRMRDLSGPAKEMLDMVAREEPDKLVIDLRQNPGGDYKEGLKHLVHPIAENNTINRKGHLFVLIGPATFSAAMSNATHFRDQTAAILVGQPIGEKPNSYQENRSMQLPNSHLTVSYSTEYYEFVNKGENLVRPDQEIKISWEDFKAGRDPALDWILKYNTAEKTSGVSAK